MKRRIHFYIYLFLYTLSIGLLLGSLSAYGDEIALTYGIGMGSPTSEHSSVESAVLSLSHTSLFLGPFDQKFEAGAWFDRGTCCTSRKSSLFGSYSLGLTVNPGILFGSIYWGAGGISAPDSVLSSHFQFFNDVSVGVKDTEGKFIGFKYKHISNAGLTTPNRGRDFITVFIGCSF